MQVLLEKDSGHNIIGTLFMNLSRCEGKSCDVTHQDDFLELIYNGIDSVLPDIQTVLSGTKISWKELKTGDIAVYKSGDRIIIGVVIGQFERQLCYVDPIDSIIKIVDYTECVSGYKYVNGSQLIIN